MCIPRLRGALKTLCVRYTRLLTTSHVHNILWSQGSHTAFAKMHTGTEHTTLTPPTVKFEGYPPT